MGNVIEIADAQLVEGFAAYLRSRAANTTDRPVYVELPPDSATDPITVAAVRKLLAEGFYAVLWCSRPHDPRQAGVTFHPAPIPADSYRDRKVIAAAYQ